MGKLVWRIVYSDVEMAWLEANRLMVISDYHAAFVAAFGRGDVTAEHLHGLRKRKGWKVGRDPGRYIGRTGLCNATELTWLRDNATMENAEYHAGFVAAFGRTDLTATQLVELRSRKGWKTGRTGTFAKGTVPANKGKKMPFNANSAATRFKLGNRPANEKPVGHERLTDDGYVMVNVEQVNPYTGGPRTYVLKHLMLWEQMHGPIPEGMCLKCLGAKGNPDPSNWEMVPRGLLPRLNGKIGRGFDTAPEEMKPTLLALARVEQAIYSAGREKKPYKPVGRRRKAEAA